MKNIAADIARCAHDVLEMQRRLDKLERENENLRASLQSRAEDFYDANEDPDAYGGGRESRVGAE